MASRRYTVNCIFWCSVSVSLIYGSCGAVLMLALVVVSLVSEVDRAVQMNVQSRRERFRQLNCNAG